jgi:ribonuclease PH
MQRKDGRQKDELRPIAFTPDFGKNADGSVLAEFGDTKVLVTAQVEEKVPPFLEGKGVGWLTSEYSLLPGSTKPRSQREATRGKQTGRTTEIQRLIGRSLRAAFDLNKLGPRTITIDADVICADASTRVVSISGAFIAVYKALLGLKSQGLIKELPLIEPVAAVSVGIVKGELLLDLTYVEDSTAEVDSNIVMSRSGQIIELQMTSERKTFDKALVPDLIELAQKGIKQIIDKQLKALHVESSVLH